MIKLFAAPGKGSASSAEFTFLAMVWRAAPFGGKPTLPLLFGGSPTWIADVGGFVAGFTVAIPLSPGGLARLRARLHRD